MAAAFPTFYVALAHDIIQIDAMAEFVVIDHKKASRGQATDKKAGSSVFIDFCDAVYNGGMQ